MAEEPYYLKPAEIAELTDAQIVEFYGVPRDAKTGAIKKVGVERKRKYSTPEENRAAFINLLTAFGKTVGEAEAAWDKAAKKEA